MKPHPNVFLRTLNRVAGLSMAAAWLASQSLSAQTIPNPSFETDTFTVFPGYVSNNIPITGWTGAPTSRIGINPAGGSPFADNGTIPSGTNVAFIQSNVDDPGNPSYLSTTVSGLTVGTTYKVTFRANARSGSTSTTPNVKVYLDDMSVWASFSVDGLSTAPVTGTSPYWYVAFEFQATAATQVLKIVNDASNDNTLLLDDFQIGVSSGKWTVAAWTSDADCGIDSNFLYTHAYNFNTGGGANINGVAFTGVAGAAPSVPGKFSTTFMVNAYTGDVNLISGDSAALAANFVYGGPSGNVPAGQFQSISMQGLTPGTEYVVTVFSVAWENPSLGSRWATFVFGEDRLTVNQDQYYNDNGITVSYRYTATSDTATIKFAPLVPANVSFHVYAFCNREAVSRFVAPVINVQPKSQVASPEVPVSFKVQATGVPVPTYQWRFKGTPIADATTTQYSIAAVASTDVGNYDVVVSNRVGVVVSSAASLKLGVAMANPSFEVDTGFSYPGYVSANGPITGWNALGGHGINPAAGSSPFANNGDIPSGVQVAFMQADGAMSQVINGLTVGSQYYVHYFENMRADYVTPGIQVTMGGTVVVPTHTVTAVGGGDYHEIFSQAFLATSADMELAFVKSTVGSGDATALIDDVAVVLIPSGTAPWITLQPTPATATIYAGASTTFSASALGSLPVSYQWFLNGAAVANATNTALTVTSAKLSDEGVYTLVVSNNFGAVTSSIARLSILEPIPSFHSTGLAADGSVLAGGAADPFWTMTVNPNGVATNAIVSTDGLFPGGWLGNSTASRWIGPQADLNATNIAGGDYTYRTTFDLTGRDTKTVVISGRWLSDNMASAVYLNGAPSAVTVSSSFSVWTAFTLTTNNATFLQGTNVLDFVVNNAGPGSTGMRLEFTQATARTLPGVPAGIGKQPAGGDLTEGDSITLSVTGTGTLPLSYQWKKNGADLPGKTDDSLILSAVTTNDTGSYSVLVSNAWGTALSAAAPVNVIYHPIPGAFGTGLNAAGQLLGDGEIDPHYIMSVSADPSFPGPNAITVNGVWPIQAGVWMLNGPDSRWIGPQADQSVGNAQGDYVYQTTVDLTGYNISKVSLRGAMAADNSVTDVLVNGVSSGATCAGFDAFTSFVLTNGLIAGVNTLDFKLNNAGTAANPTALRVNLKAYINIQVTAPKLQISRSGTSVSISWSPVVSGQKLMWASDLMGPWTEITGASNPYVTPATGKQVFYRIVQ